MIHVSDMLHIKRCPRFAWNSRFKRKKFESFYHVNRPFYEIWSEYLKLDSYAMGEVGDTNEDTFQKMKEHDVILMGRFEYNETRTKIPYLERKDDGYLVIYPYLNAAPKESEATLMKINYEILKHCGIHVVDQKVLYINKDYVRKSTLDIDELFCVSHTLFNRKNRPGHTIEECFETIELNLDEWIQETKDVLNSDMPIMPRTKTCTSSRRCAYYEDCFDDACEPDDSILFLTTSQYKFEEYENGIRHIHELDSEKLDGFRLQYSQYMASQYGYFMDRAALQTWMKDIQYPISYLDFEWDTFAIPPYENMKPFDVLCFQYSLHIEEKDQNLKHLDFFKSGDCRIDFIESLIRDIPKTGTILVYNMEGAEKLRLKQLSVQFPQYKEQLDSICDRMIDLSKPFEAGLFYDNRMRGHYSLKSILPVFTDEYSYAQLSIQTGLSAVHAYRTFDTSTPLEKEEILKNIRNYCKMDTFAEYVVYHGLQKYLKEDLNA